MKYKVLAECSGADCNGVHRMADGGSVPAACAFLLQMAKDKGKGSHTIEFDPRSGKYQMDSAGKGLWLCYDMDSGLCINYMLLQEDGGSS